MSHNLLTLLDTLSRANNPPKVKEASVSDRLEDSEHERYIGIGVDGLVAASEKLLAVNRGVTSPDTRDMLPNDRVYGVDYLMPERIKLDHGRILKGILNRAAFSKSLKSVSSDAFGGYTTGYISGNPLVSAVEEINPMHLLEQQNRITKMGPGGIGDPNAITKSMQMVHGSEFGFVDPIAGPESDRAGIDVRLAHGSRLGEDGKIYSRHRNLKTGAMEWLSSNDTADLTVKLPD